MSNSTELETETGGGACRSLCWLTGLVVGAYGAFALFTDFSLPLAQAGLYGLAIALVLGAVLRLVLCRGRGNRVRERVREAKIEADAAVEKPRVRVSRSKADDTTPPPAAPVAGPAPLADAAKDDAPKDPAEKDRGEEAPGLGEAAQQAPAAALGIEEAGEAEPETAPEATRDSAPAPAPVKPMKPRGLEAPEDGAPEDLDRIEGLDKALRAALNEAGIFHSHQFVTMNRRELAWLDENIAQDGGRAEEWRKRAIALSRKKSA